MEQQIFIIEPVIGAALGHPFAPASVRAAAGTGLADAADVDAPRPPGSWTDPLR